MSGRRAAGRVAECSLWLPAGSGAVAVAGDGRPGDGMAGDGTAGDGVGDGPEAA